MPRRWRRGWRASASRPSAARWSPTCRSAPPRPRARDGPPRSGFWRPRRRTASSERSSSGAPATAITRRSAGRRGLHRVEGRDDLGRPTEHDRRSAVAQDELPVGRDAAPRTSARTPRRGRRWRTPLAAHAMLLRETIATRSPACTPSAARPPRSSSTRVASSANVVHSHMPSRRSPNRGRAANLRKLSSAISTSEANWCELM